MNPECSSRDIDKIIGISQFILIEDIFMCQSVNGDFYKPDLTDKKNYRPKAIFACFSDSLQDLIMI
jgi:hypothetical protein